ncbi:hypothetical protein J4407_01480 [Candidatus Pacearchaeota archaeon]|nr:hypothetical protein [Candidatus Pacearchaeota archaeon]
MDVITELEKKTYIEFPKQVDVEQVKEILKFVSKELSADIDGFFPFGYLNISSGKIKRFQETDGRKKEAWLGYFDDRNICVGANFELVEVFYRGNIPKYYAGIWFKPRLSWKSHNESNESKVRVYDNVRRVITSNSSKLVNFVS